MATTKEQVSIPKNSDWVLATDKAGYVAVNNPVYFAYSSETPAVTGEYTKNRIINNDTDGNLYIRSLGQSVTYVVVEA